MNDHTPNPDPATDDANLTAYALGELTPGSAEHVAVEARLSQDPAARAEVESIAAAAAELTAALATEPSATNSTKPRMSSAVLNDSQKNPIPTSHWPRRLAFAAGLAAAAALGVALILPQFGSARRTARQLTTTQPHPGLSDDQWLAAAGHDAAPTTRAGEGRDSTPQAPSSIGTPEFDLTDSLSNTNSGGGGGGGDGIERLGVGGGRAQTFSGDADGDARANSEFRWQQTLNSSGVILGDARPASTPTPQLALGRESSTRTPTQSGDWRGSITRSDNATEFETADRFESTMYSEIARARRLKAANSVLTNREANIPYAEIITYPEDWPELSETRIRGLDDTRGESEANRETQLNLSKTVPINFDANPLESVIDYLRETTDANIFVNWPALIDAGGIEPDAPITLSLENVPADFALKFVLNQAALGFGEPIDFAIINGVVIISTKSDLERGQKQLNHEFNTEAYDRVTDNPFLTAIENPLSTFSIDVDTASYANVRRFLTSGGSGGGQLPAADAVRIEELVNYFDYGYEPPAIIPNFEQGPTFHLEDGAKAVEQPPFAAHVTVTASPWSPGNRLVRIGLKGKEIATDDRPAANLVFLLDVSGSMNQSNKLPLVKAGMKKLVQALRMDDRVAIVVYAGASGLVLDSTSDHDAVLAAIDNLTPGGSTNGAAGIELAYQQAVQNHIPGGLNRVILCTDGDFNVGITDRGSLTRLIEEKANAPETPTYLTVLGFGTGNLKDATMEELSNVGDGNYGYIDSPAEAEKLLAEQVNATLLTIAKDVKIQVEFNPRKVKSYRLVGYENRLLAKEDFNNDVVDAGDIGAGHTVTALYEIVPAGTVENRVPQVPGVDDLKYQPPAPPAPLADDVAGADELLTLKLRYKQPDAAKVQGTSKLLEFPVKDAGGAFEDADEEVQFAAAVAGFGMLLRGSPYAGDLTWDALQRWSQQHVEGWEGNLGILTAEQQRRVEFAELVSKARALAERTND